MSLFSTIATDDGKTSSTFDLQHNIIFANNDGAKVNKFVHNVEGIVDGRNLGSGTLHVPTCGPYILLATKKFFQLSTMNLYILLFVGQKLHPQNGLWNK